MGHYGGHGLIKKKIYVEQDQNQDSSSSISVNSRRRGRINDISLNYDADYHGEITMARPAEKKETTQSVTHKHFSSKKESSQAERESFSRSEISVQDVSGEKIAQYKLDDDMPYGLNFRQY